MLRYQVLVNVVTVHVEFQVSEYATIRPSEVAVLKVLPSVSA
jgi:hypothetical protein